MRVQRFFCLRRSGCALVGAVWCLTAATAVAQEAKIVVGVISPTDPNGGVFQRSIGASHEATIRFAFAQLNDAITIGLRQYRIDARYLGDRGDSAKAVEAARALVAQGAVAILGPVDSGSTKAVLAAGLEIPVLSATSTAQSLSDPRDPWFFRLTHSDRDRVRQYLETLREQGKLERPRIAVYDAASTYGSELEKEVVAQLGGEGEIDAEVSWDELVGDRLQSEEGRKQIRIGAGFATPAVGKLGAAPATIFVLGTSGKAALIANGIEAYFKEIEATPAKRQFLFVGHDNDLRATAPQGSMTIGDPEILDLGESSASALRDAFRSYSQKPDLDFIVTAYEAAHDVLPGALERALDHAASTDAAIPSPEVLRERLRDALESGKFQSTEPWRSITLRNGEIQGAPDLPVYSIDSEFRLVGSDARTPYLDVHAPAWVGYLEGGVTIHLKRHGKMLGGAPAILRADVTPPEVVPADFVEQGDDLDISFYPSRPGSYQLRASVAMSPPVPSVTVSLGGAYPLAFLGGAIGSIVVLARKGVTGRRRWLVRVAGGGLVGAILIAAQLHKSMLPFAIPIPSIGGSPLVAAFWAGITGGLGGPSLLLLLFPAGRPDTPDDSQKDRDVAADAHSGHAA